MEHFSSVSTAMSITKVLDFLWAKGTENSRTSTSLCMDREQINLVKSIQKLPETGYSRYSVTASESVLKVFITGKTLNGLYHQVVQPINETE